MKKFKLLLVMFILCVCAVMSFAGQKPDGKGGRPQHFGTNAMFAMIADDLKLTGEQRTQYEQITAELIEIKKQSWNRKIDEFKSFLQLISKGSASDAEIDEFEQKRTENEFAFQNAIAGKMVELYNILDKNQQKRFIDKMTIPCDNRDKFGKAGHGNNKHGKMPPHKQGHHNHNGKFDKNAKHRMPPKGPHGKPNMSKGPHHNGKGPQGRPDMNKAPQGKDGRNHQYGHNMKFSKHSMMLNAVAWELKLNEQQREVYQRVKNEIHTAEEELYAKCSDDRCKCSADSCECSANKCQCPPEHKKNPCGQFDYLIRGESEQQIKDAITNRLQKDEQIRKLALKKYFEFCQCLTDAQKEVLKLKYQYDIAKMNLPSPNDRK